jgi:hypothetical protein
MAVTHSLSLSAEPLFIEDGNPAHGYKSKTNYCTRFYIIYSIVLMPYSSSFLYINPIEKC